LEIATVAQETPFLGFLGDALNPKQCTGDARGRAISGLSWNCDRLAGSSLVTNSNGDARAVPPVPGAQNTLRLMFCATESAVNTPDALGPSSPRRRTGCGSPGALQDGRPYVFHNPLAAEGDGGAPPAPRRNSHMPAAVRAIMRAACTLRLTATKKAAHADSRQCSEGPSRDWCEAPEPAHRPPSERVCTAGLMADRGGVMPAGADGSDSGWSSDDEVGDRRRALPAPVASFSPQLREAGENAVK
jgi:hypothetical protein